MLAIGRRAVATILLAVATSAANGQELRGKTYSFTWGEKLGRIYVSNGGNAFLTFGAIGTGMEFKANKKFRASTTNGCFRETFAAHSGNLLTLDFTNGCPAQGNMSVVRVVLSSDGVACSVRWSGQTSFPPYPDSTVQFTSDSCAIVAGNQM